MFAKRTKGKFANGKLGFLPTVSAKSLEPTVIRDTQWVSIFFIARLTGREPVQSEALQRANFSSLRKQSDVVRHQENSFVCCLWQTDRAP